MLRKRPVGSHTCSKMLHTVTFHCVEAWLHKVLVYIMPYQLPFVLLLLFLRILLSR